MYTASWSKDGRTYAYSSNLSNEEATKLWESYKNAGYRYGGVRYGAFENPNGNNKPSIPPVLLYGGIVALIYFLTRK